MTDAAKFLATMHMLGMMVDEARVKHTCSNCRFRIEHDLAEVLGIPCKPWREWL